MENVLYDSLRGKIALVTGAGSGIGAALAKRFGSLGVRAVCVGRTEKTIKEIASWIKSSGGEAIHFVADATNPHQMEALAKEIKNTCWTKPYWECNKKQEAVKICLANRGHSIFN